MSDNSLPGAQPLEFEAPGADPCHAGALAHLIGKPVPDAETLAALVGPKRLRVIGPGDAVTMDHMPQRLNIETDNAGIVLRLRCG